MLGDQLAAHLLGQLDQHVALRPGVDELPGDGALRGRQRLEEVSHLGGMQRVHHAVRPAQAPGGEGLLDRGDACTAVVEGGSGLGHCGQSVVAHEELRVLRAEVCREPLDEVDGAVLAAGAADCDSKVAAVGLLVFGQPALDEADEVLDHRADARACLEELDDASRRGP